MKKLRIACLTVLFIFSIFTAACTNVTPLTPETPNSLVPQNNQAGQSNQYTVTYNYTDTGPVQLSSNNVTLKVGQKLILQPASGLTSNTRFTSAGENFWGNIMEQSSVDSSATNAVFTATKTGKGKLTIIPNGTDTDRAADLWATVE